MVETELPHVDIFTDGACRGNPGPGGWGAILRRGRHEKELRGAKLHTTNNRMELMATIQALRALKKPCSVKIVTDSEYVRKGITVWITSWKTRDWRTSNKNPVKNVDIWKELDELVQQHNITWHWVKGHSGHPENERADQLANQAIDELSH